MAAAPPTDERLIKSKGKKLVPGPGEPPLDMDRIQAYADNPMPETEKFALQLVQHCGPLVLDGIQYRDEGGKLRAIPVEFLGMERQKLATAIDKLQVERI